MRLVRMARRRLIRITGGRRYARLPKVALRLRANDRFESLARRELIERRAESTASNARAICRGRFRFLNVERDLPDPVDWRLECWPEVAHLWRFHLHYHEFLLDLAAEGLGGGRRIAWGLSRFSRRENGTVPLPNREVIYRPPLKEDDRGWFERAWDLVRQWIEGNPLSDPRVFIDAWHPYCISRRLPAWIRLWSACPPSEELRDGVLGSIFSQARYLEGHLERDLGGNHLLENLRAMLLVGAFLDGPDADRWLAKGARLLRKELAEQVLPHGEHFERSPMYHAEMLEAVLDVRDALAAVMPDLGQLCSETAAKMAAFLGEIIHPDGEIPLLGDACFGQTPPPARLIARAAASDCTANSERRDRQRAPHRAPGACRLGGYWTYREDGDFLLFDAGPVGPDHLPAHAHADLLSFEASIRGRRLFVDSGVFNYEDDPMRRYCRSTAAHNVLELDDRDQCDMWSRFRMGYRGWPFEFAVGETDRFHWAAARHNAYRRVGVPAVGRWIGCRSGGPWLCVDWAEGTGTHTLSARLHLHPDVLAEEVADDEVRLEIDGVVLALRYLTAGQITLAEGWYCSEFGRREPAPVVRWTASVKLPAACGWSLTWGDCRGAARLDQTPGKGILLEWTENDELVQLQVSRQAVPKR